MSDPVRLRDDPNASAFVRDLLSSAHAPADIPSEVATQLREPPSPPPSVPRPWKLWLVAGVGTVVVALVAARALVPQARPAATFAPEQPAQAPAAQHDVTVPARSETPHARTTAREVHASPVVTAAQPALRDAGAPRTGTDAPLARTSPARPARDEAELLELARRELRDHPVTAVAILRSHVQSFPRSRLTEEREVLFVRAYRKLGRATDARDRAVLYLHRYPRGIYASSMRALLEDPQ